MPAGGSIARIKRTQHCVRAIAVEFKRAGHYKSVLTPEFDEMTVMKQHAEFGRNIIYSTAEHSDGENFLHIAGAIADTHHEKCDSTGYPLGLAGQEIPLARRIMAVADIHDALISRCCCKNPFEHAFASTLMRAMKGTTFDPLVHNAVLNIESEVKEIAAKFKDEAGGTSSGATVQARQRNDALTPWHAWPCPRDANFSATHHLRRSASRCQHPRWTTGDRL